MSKDQQVTCTRTRQQNKPLTRTQSNGATTLNSRSRRRNTYSTCRVRRHGLASDGASGWRLAFTRYSCSSRLLCKTQPSVHSPRLPALPTLVQYYCNIIGQYTPLLPTSRVYALHHTILVITISCKGQVGG